MDHPSPTATTTATTPTTVTRSDPSNPYPTTFVQADSSSFKQVVQMLTGSPTHHHHHNNNHRPTTAAATTTTTTTHKSKLYERRNNHLNHLRISPLLPPTSAAHHHHHSPRHHPNHPYYKTTTPTTAATASGGLLSPSLLDFPALMLSPVTPLLHDPFAASSNNSSPVNVIDKVAEEKAIAEKGFFLHPVSPGSDYPEPRLLPLFPLSSPKVSTSHY